MNLARTNLRLIPGLLLASIALAGCQGYSSYPTVDGATMTNRSPDAPPQYQIAGMAARYVADRYPPSAPSWASGEPNQAPEHFVVNIPSGMSRIPYERAIGVAGPGAEAPSPSNANLPVYHIARIWSRGHQGVVDVMRPVAEVGEAPGGKPVYQTITVYFEGGFQPWRITGRLVRDALTPEVPALAFLPGSGPEAPAGQPPVQANTNEKGAGGQANFSVIRGKRKPVSLAAGDSVAGSVFQVNDAFSSGQPRMATVPSDRE